MIGGLNQRVDLESPSLTPDTGGGSAIAWTPVATVFASVSARAVSESVAADALASRVVHDVVIRFRDDVAAGWRVVHQGRSLRVRAVVDRDARRRFLHLDCEDER